MGTSVNQGTSRQRLEERESFFFFFVNIFYQWSNVYSKNKKGCKKGEVGGQKKEKYCSELEQE